jgi:hypothetical protein
MRRHSPPGRAGRGLLQAAVVPGRQGDRGGARLLGGLGSWRFACSLRPLVPKAPNGHHKPHINAQTGDARRRPGREAAR